MEQNDTVDNICKAGQDDNMGLSDIIDILNTLDNNSPEFNESPTFLEVKAITNATSLSSSGSSSPTFNQKSQKSQKSTNILSSENTNTATEKPYIRIVEQPANKALRFRYECEGRSAGSIPGASSTTENKTFPTIEIAEYRGEVTIVVSCVTKDPPYRPHPHNLVGKEGCEYGICTMRVKGDPPRAVFSNLGVQCVRKKDIKAALELRENRNVDPFKTKFAHKDQPSSIDLNVVRLCFQAFIQTGPRQYKKLTPVVSDPVYDRKAVSDLAINRLCSCSAKMSGGDEIIMLCEKVPKDIKIKFYELNNEGIVVWEDYAVFQHTDIHKHTAIAFKTPRYHNPDAIHRPQVYIQLVRPSDGATSEPLPFEYYSDPDETKRKRLRSGGNAMNILRRELQKHEQMRKFNEISNSNMNTWNIPPIATTPPNEILPEIKPENHGLSMYNFGPHRSPYQSHSPSPLSPMNRNMTPSPNLLRTPSAGSQTQMSDSFNQLITNNDCANLHTLGVKSEHSNNQIPFHYDDNFFNVQKHVGNVAVAFNPFINPTSGGSITPLWPMDNSQKISNSSQFQVVNLPQTSYNYQQQQNQLNCNNTIDNGQQTLAFQSEVTVPVTNDMDPLNSLLQIGSDQFVNLNSDDLKLSNLSIST
uniref:RHD domain-containing protein n=1 Tax=Glossina brevipalpis TaxID=37001 RepID=A0A1A9WBI8_9MUSC